MHRNSQYDLMEKAYVTGGDEVTITSLATQYGRGKSAVSRMARIQSWYDKRASYRSSLAGRTYDATIDAYGSRIVALNGKFITAAEKTVDRYIEALERKEITPTAAELAKIMTAVQEAVGKPAASESPEGNGDIRIPQGVGVEAIRALEQLARTRLEPGSGSEATRPKLVSTGV